MNIVVYSLKAIADIDLCYNYIARELKAHSTADKLIELLERKLDMMEVTPEAWHLVHHEFLALRGVRAVSVKKYILFYRFEAESSVIRLLRFLPGRMNWARILLKDFEEEEG